jgi:hypothetical protein
MTAQELHFHHAQRPFEPFRLLVADGRSYDVKHPERLASLEPGGGRRELGRPQATLFFYWRKYCEEGGSDLEN